MKVAEAVVQILSYEGISDVFGIPGAGINPVYKYLKDAPMKKHVHMLRMVISGPHIKLHWLSARLALEPQIWLLDCIRLLSTLFRS